MHQNTPGFNPHFQQEREPSGDSTLLQTPTRHVIAAPFGDRKLIVTISRPAYPTPLVAVLLYAGLLIAGVRAAATNRYDMCGALDLRLSDVVA